jgi:glycosyltransferase involved in cell wall biosynthesis
MQVAETLVIMPTFDHERLLRYSIASVLAQTYQDFQLVVIGDGSPPGTAAVVGEFDDPRVEYRPHDKSPRTGEPYRDPVIRSSGAKFVTYAGDDDLWLPNHLDSITSLLQNAEFVHTLPTEVMRSGVLLSWIIDLSDPKDRDMLVAYENRLPPSVIGHTVEAYVNLPVGWSTAPDGIPTDVFMWSKFFRNPDLVAKGSHELTSLKFVQSIRNDMSASEREEELAFWWPLVSDQSWRASNLPEMTTEGIIRSWHDTDILYRESRAQLERLSARLEIADSKSESISATAQTHMEERDRARYELAWVKQSPFWRLRGFVVGLPGVSRIVRIFRDR